TTSYDENGNATTTTSNESSGPSTTAAQGESDLEPSTFDPHNPACQQLATLQVLPGISQSLFWDKLFKRPYFVDPRTVNPNPAGITIGVGKEPFCDAQGLGDNNPPSKCLSPEMCSPMTSMSDSCRCQPPTAQPIALRGCISTVCPPGQNPIPVGATYCICQEE